MLVLPAFSNTLLITILMINFSLHLGVVRNGNGVVRVYNDIVTMAGKGNMSYLVLLNLTLFLF